MGAKWRIALCGGLAVWRDGERIEGRLAGRQGREVFAYLVLNRRRSVSRDEVTALLWPERPPQSPEAVLNTILARLRRELGPSALGSRGQLALQLPGDTWVDVEAAEAAAVSAEERLAVEDLDGALHHAGEALSLLESPLLPELRHAWTEHRRTELDDTAARALMVATRAGLALGGPHLPQAERSAQRLIEREPFRESGYALLMEVRAAQGDVAEALLVYERLRALLRDELGIGPSPHVAALHQRLLSEERAPAPRAPAPRSPHRVPHGAPHEAEAQTREGALLPLPGPLARGSAVAMAGRAQELDVLRAWWEGAEPDRGAVAAVAGEPGIGKSTLVAALARAVHDGGVIVLYGQAEEDPIVPHVALVDALRRYLSRTPELVAEPRMGSRLAELRWLIPELRDLAAEPEPPSGDPRLDRMRLYHAMAAVIGHASARGDVLLVLEDLQWADADTLLIARQLLREATLARPLRAVLTYREGEVDVEHPLSRMLADARRDLPVTRMSLAGLDEAGVLAMLDGAAPHEVVRELRDHTSGNPFFIGEVVRSLDEVGAGIADPGRAAGGLRDLPEGVLAVIQERLRRLAPETRDALGAAAVLGPEFSLELLEAVLDGASAIDGTSAASAIDGAVRAGLVSAESRPAGRHRFHHALAREAIYASLGPGLRSNLHLAAARALERHAATPAIQPAEIAHHLAESNRSDTAAEAVVHLREAARRALASHAYDEAAQHLRRALELQERHDSGDSETRCALLLELGQASWQAASPHARGVYQQALTVARGLGRPAQLAEAALGLGGRFYAPTVPDLPYLALLEETLEALGDDDPSLRTRILARLSEHLMMVDSDRAAALSAAALAAARELSDPAVLAGTLLSRHAALLAAQHLPERRQLGQEQVAIAHAAGERELEALGVHWLLYDLMEAGDVAGAAGAQSRLAELAEELDQPLYRHSALVWQRSLEQVAGRLDVAAQLAHEALHISRGAQGRAAKIHFVAQELTVVRDVGGAERLLVTSRRWPSNGSLLWLSARWLLELECDDLSKTDSDRDAAVDGIDELPHTVFWLPIVAWLAEAVAAAGTAAQAERLYEILLPFGEQWVQLVFNGSFGSVQRYLGLLAGRIGRPEDAAAHLLDAVGRHGAAGAPALEARARADYGRAVMAGRAAGSPAQASAMLHEAVALADGCGALRLAAAAQAALPAPAPALSS